MPSARIVAVAAADPRDRRTWSGTPAALCEVLDARGLLAGGFSATEVTLRRTRAITHALSRLLYYPATLTGYGGPVRRAKGRKVARTIDAANADAALHFMTTHLPLPRGERRVLNYLYVDTSQRLWGEYAAERHSRRGRLERAVQRLERESLEQMDHIFTISHYLRDEFVDHYGIDPAKITVAGSGRGRIAPYAGPKDYSTPRLLYVALNWGEKGGQLALDGFRLARARRADVSMTIVCEKPKAEELSAAGIDGLTALTGVSWERLQNLYDAATLFVMPAPHQPWGLAYVEALSCRAPIVGLDRLSTPELTGYGSFGWVLKQGTPEELAEIILEAHADPKLLPAMGERGAAYCAEHFSWERVADLIERQLFRDCTRS